jgi:hypothetical protein
MQHTWGEPDEPFVGDGLLLPKRPSSTKLPLATVLYLHTTKRVLLRPHVIIAALMPWCCCCCTHVPDLLERALPRLALDPARPIFVKFLNAYEGLSLLQGSLLLPRPVTLETTRF